MGQDTLGEIMDLVPEAQLHAIVQRYIKLPKGATHANLLAEVRSFDAASRAGDFYEDFEVNSKNLSELSPGTECWIGECERLYRRVIAAIPMALPEHAREALGLLIGLLRDVDDDNDIVFWADEGGSWQVGIDWKEIMTFWFKALAATSEPAGYAQAATNAVNDFLRFGESSISALRISTRIQTNARRWRHRRNHDVRDKHNPPNVPPRRCAPTMKVGRNDPAVPDPDDPILLQELQSYGPIDPEKLAKFISHFTSYAVLSLGRSVGACSKISIFITWALYSSSTGT